MNSTFCFKKNRIRIQDIVIVTMLIVMCVNQFRIIKLLNKSYYTDLININRNRSINFERDYDRFIKDVDSTMMYLDKMMEESKKNFFEDYSFLGNKKVENNNTYNDNKYNDSKREFIFYPKTKSDDKEFSFNMRLPKNFNESNLNVSFENKMLTVSFEEAKEDKNSSYYSSFMKQFFVSTTATNDEITKKIENNTLTIIIPIKK